MVPWTWAWYSFGDFDGVFHVADVVQGIENTENVNPVFTDSRINSLTTSSGVMPVTDQVLAA